MMAKDELETVLDLDSQRLDTLTSMVTKIKSQQEATLTSQVTSAATFTTLIL